jgi:hypothetical protein
MSFSVRVVKGLDTPGWLLQGLSEEVVEAVRPNDLLGAIHQVLREIPRWRVPISRAFKNQALPGDARGLARTIDDCRGLRHL